MKELCVIVTGWSYEYLNGETEEYKIARETVKHPDFGLTGREILQKVGTDLFRNNFDKDVWVKIMKRRIEASPETSVVFSDLRFVNECEMVQELGGTIIRLKRGPERPAFSLFNLWTWMRLFTGDFHESEALFDTPGEIVVENNGTLEELYAAIDAICGSKRKRTRPNRYV